MKNIRDLTDKELDYLTMKLDGQDFMFGGQYKSYFEPQRALRLIDEMRVADQVNLLGGQYGWVCSGPGGHFAGQSLVEACLRCWCVWKNGSGVVPDDFFKELYE